MQKPSIRIIATVIVLVMLPLGALFASGKQEAGEEAEVKELVYHTPVHHFTTALKEKIPEFEAETGIKVTVNELPEEEFYKKTTIELSSGSPSFDIFLLNQGFVGQYVEGGWVEPIMPYVNDPELTDKAAYDLEDYPQAALARPTYMDKLWAIPASVEPQIMFYRKDVLQQGGLSLPKTMDTLYEAAVKIKKADAGIAGIINRLRRGAGSYWPWLGFVSNYKGTWVDENNNVGLTDPKTMQATEMYIKLLKDAGPETALNYGWYECLTGFQQGKAAFLMDANSWMAAFQDEEKSAVAGKVGASVMPASPSGYIQAAGGASWMMAIPSQTAKKKAAWNFISWATSKEVALHVAINGGDIARNSTWSEPEFKDAYPFPDWIKASQDTTNKYNSTYFLPYHPKMGAMGEIVDVTLQEIYIGNPLEEQLAKAEKETMELLK